MEMFLIGLAVAVAELTKPLTQQSMELPARAAAMVATENHLI
jgi:hypothetical protein